MYKIVDGVLYQSSGVSASSIKTQLDNLEASLRPHYQAIESCNADIAKLTLQIDAQKNAIREIISKSGIDTAMASAVDPDRAKSLLGF